MITIPAFDMVLFGSTGDLAMRKLLPALYFQHKEDRLPAEGRIFCIGRTVQTQAQYLQTVREAAIKFIGNDFEEAAWVGFSARLQYLQFDITDGTAYSLLANRLAEKPAHVRVFYLATAPSLFIEICKNLSGFKLNKGTSRVVLEKPLGNDLASSRAINAAVAAYFDERQVYRIDHYLGKEAVQNLLALRFGNTLFEPLWRREWIDNVQITVTEQVGVEGRGDFYEKTGALRDMVQSHLLQLLCMVAMEPPANIDSDSVRDEKLKILRALRPFTPNDVAQKIVRGQYRAGAIGTTGAIGYADEEGIAAESCTETFVALRAEIDTWRWAGVPFFLRTGKRMQERLAEIVVNFRQVPHAIFPLTRNIQNANRLVIRLQPDESVTLHLLAKQPGGDEIKLHPVTLDLDSDESAKIRRPDAYERLLTDVIRGQLTLFMRSDELEEAWAWVEPILEAWRKNEDPPKLYQAGSWGPAASTALLSRDGFCWHEES